MKRRAATVLVVDDEPQNRKLLQALLDVQGYITTTAASGELALASVASDPPDLILLDVMMPGMDGYQVAAELKSHASTASIPIIMVSALNDRQARVRGLDAGAEDFLTKPVDKAELWLRVRNLLRLKDLSDKLQGQSSVLEEQVKARTADLHQLAHYDELTGVQNRAYLHDTLRKTLPVAAAQGWTVAVMFVDIDNFKLINDTLGHAAGDALLAQFSGRLVESLRVRDTVGRLGGDEFALIVLLETGQKDGGAIVAAKVHQAMQRPFDLQGRRTCITASIGITIFPDDSADPEILLRNADIAMYRAKAAGRNTFRFFSAAMNEDAVARFQLEAASRTHSLSTGALALGLLNDMDAPACAVDEAGAVTAINRAWRDVESDTAAVPPDVDIGASYLAVLAPHHGRDAGPVATGVRQVLTGKTDRFEFSYSRTTGRQQRWFNLVAFPLPNGTGAVISHRDVTLGHRAAATLAHRGSHDMLTELPNRDHVLKLLGEALDFRLPDGGPVAVACVGVDGLKHINDSYGYAAGDELLQAISVRVAARLRTGDTLARFAGDVFAVIWPGVSTPLDAAELARRVAAVFAVPFELAAGSVSISASVGTALGSAPQTAEDLLLTADAAMREAHRQNPRRTSMCASEVQSPARSRIRLEDEIRLGLARGEFALHYQPIVDLQQRTVTGVEALVRWKHPDGLRMPDAFISIAEQSGLIVPLGAWILGEACRQSARWSAAGLDLTMAVNLSMSQVSDPGLLEVVQEALRQAKMPPERLLLELTESAAMEHAEVALAVLVSLHGLGTGIAIDDFGTGYSSLLYLKRYPIHTLKIDRAFVGGMGINPDDDAIVASVVSLARAVGASCTAEGVETSAQAAALRELGCHSAQGYLFAKPVAADALPNAVERCEQQMRLPLLAPGGRGSAAPDEVPQRVLNRIGELQAAGASINTIAAALNRDGGRGPGRVRWTDASVDLVLRASGMRTPVPISHVTEAAP